MEYKNGSIWRNGETIALLQQLTDNLFCLLAVGDIALTLIIDPVHTGKWQYSVEEVPERLDGWKQIQTNFLAASVPPSQVIEDSVEETPSLEAAPEKAAKPVKRKVKNAKSKS